MLLSLVSFRATGWITISQAKFGAELGAIRAQLHGNSTGDLPPDQELGYLWSLPGRPPHHHVAVGKSVAAEQEPLRTGGITWQWDPYLCDVLVPGFREDILGVRVVTCDSLKAAMARRAGSQALG